MSELSVIIPFCNEYPQNIFTIQSIAQELRDRVDFEILAVDNYCDEVKAQGRFRDGGGDAVAACAKGNSWLKYLQYTEKLSHWQAKNHAVKHASGKFLWFCDAHCIVSRDSLYRMFAYYRDNYERLDGTLHLPLTYKILEWHRLIYKLDADIERGSVHYSFTSCRDSDRPFRVPCMSTCGMMMTRDLYDEVGGWPRELGIYGGGENFLNFTLAVLGKTVNIYPAEPLFHHGEKRGYAWNYTDLVRNRCVATYIFGGEELARGYINHVKGRPEVLDGIFRDVIARCRTHREMIEAKQRIDIREWVQKWQK